jgi:hypothetical protein
VNLGPGTLGLGSALVHESTGRARFFLSHSKLTSLSRGPRTLGVGSALVHESKDRAESQNPWSPTHPKMKGLLEHQVVVATSCMAPSYGQSLVLVRELDIVGSKAKMRSKDRYEAQFEQHMTTWGGEGVGVEVGGDAVVRCV